MIELLLPCEFDTLEYSWVKVVIGICTLADYSMAKKHQQACIYRQNLLDNEAYVWSCERVRY
jgi:hypothetical protein